MLSRPVEIYNLMKIVRPDLINLISIRTLKGIALQKKRNTA
jgi:hypothetical protein